MYILYARRSIDTLICSYGGTGTTMLISFFSQYKNCNDPKDRDRLKHVDRPPISLNPNLKAIYIYGEPVPVLCSLFRRNFHHVQSRKLLRNHSEIAPIGQSVTLDAYARIGVDRFRFDEHFGNWHTRCYQYPVLFVKYDALWDSLAEIFQFLEIPHSETRFFPQKESRKSSVEHYPPATILELEKMYRPFIDEIRSLPAIQIIQRKERFADKLYLPGRFVLALYHTIIQTLLVRRRQSGLGSRSIPFDV